MADASQTLRIALAQINAVVGDIDGNAAKIGEQIARARDVAGGLFEEVEELAILGGEDLGESGHGGESR